MICRVPKSKSFYFSELVCTRKQNRLSFSPDWRKWYTSRRLVFHTSVEAIPMSQGLKRTSNGRRLLVLCQSQESSSSSSWIVHGRTLFSATVFPCQESGYYQKYRLFWFIHPTGNTTSLHLKVGFVVSVVRPRGVSIQKAHDYNENTSNTLHLTSPDQPALRASIHARGGPHGGWCIHLRASPTWISVTGSQVDAEWTGIITAPKIRVNIFILDSFRCKFNYKFHYLHDKLSYF